MYDLHQIFNKFTSIFKHTDNLEIGLAANKNVCSK